MTEPVDVEPERDQVVANNLARVLNERRRLADEREPIDLNAINRRRFDRFLDNIKQGKDYTFLSVYFYTIGDAEEIAEELKNNSTLQYLSMPNCYAGRRKIKPIMDSLKSNEMCRLIFLDLNDNRLEDLGCFLVCEFLKTSRTIHSVSLRANRITGNGKHSGAKYLADVLKVSQTLTRLDIGQNRFGPEGAGYIDKALKANETLQFLDISDNNLLAEGIRRLGNIFLVNQALKVLRLQHNNIGLEGAEQIAHFLSQNMESPLEQLTLLDKYSRVLVLRGLLERCRTEDITEEFLKKILMKSDLNDRKVLTVRSEWESAKLAGQELVKIPQEVFEFQEAEAIKTFLKSALVEGLSSNKAVKMLMVGRARAGKTSLTNSLVNDECGLTKDDDNRATVSVEIRPWNVEDVTISVWDFAGQEEYYMTHTFFLSRRCVVVLIVDLAKYQDFQNDVYYWVKAIQAHVPGVSFFMVGTHIDEMEPEKIKEKSEEILIKFQEEERRIVLALDKQLELLEEANAGNYQELAPGTGTDPNNMSSEEAAEYANEYVEGDTRAKLLNRNNNVIYMDNEQMARIREQRDRRPSILHNTVYAVSSKQMEGIPELREAIVKHATDEEVAIRLPNSYVQLLEKLKDFGEMNKTSPIVSRSQVKNVVGEAIHSKFDDDDEVDSALELLHLVGQLLWYRTNNQLMDRIFVSPRWVVDITKALVRHDMFLTEHGNPGIIDQLPKPNKMKTKEFNLMKKKFKTEAVFDMRFLSMLETWKDINEVNRFKLVSLLKEFDLIIPLPKKKKSDNDECLIPLYLKSSFHGREQPAAGSKVLIAGLNRGLRKSVLGLIGEELATKEFKMDKNRVLWRYDLHEYFPEGIFFRILVRCYSLGKVKQVEEDMLYCKVGKDIKIVLKEDRKKNHIMLAASHRKNLQLVWPALVLFATEFEDLLRESYKGVSCQVMCIAADARLRERALCNHEDHKDMVPPMEYMHVVWGNINAVQVGVLLRLRNISQHINKANDNAEEDVYQARSEVNLLAKEAFSLLERLLQNVCKVNDIPVKHGRSLKSYLDSIRDSQQFADMLENGTDSEWKGEVIDEALLGEAMDLYEIFTKVVNSAGGLLERDFTLRLIEVAKKFIPNLEEKETEFEKNLMSTVVGAGLNPSAKFMRDRVLVANDILSKIKEVVATAEAQGGNKDLEFVVRKPEEPGTEKKD